MNNNFTINDLLDQWVKNEITFDELALISGRENVSELQESMNMHKLAVHAIQKHATAIQVSSIHQKYLNKRREQAAPVKVVSISRNKLAVRIASAAAVFAAVLIVAQLVFNTSNRIYSESFTAYYVNNERSAVTQSSGNITALFNKGDYKGVVSAYKAGEGKAKKDVFLAGYASLMMKDYQGATTYFTSIIDDARLKNDLLFLDEAEYYLTLTYLRAGKHEEAFQLMSRIYSDPEHTYHDAFNKWTMMRMKWVR